MHKLSRHVLAALALASAAMAARAEQPATPPAAAPSPAQLRAEALRGLQKPITVALEGARLEDVFQFVSTVSGVQFDVKWADDVSIDGLDKEAKVDLAVQNVSTLALVERVLDRAAEGGLRENTWQLDEVGLVQVGPKRRLNASSELRVYPIEDLLFEIPSFRDFPELDLDSVLNQRQGGGAGSIFQQTEQASEGDRLTRAALVERILEIITTTIEPDQWLDNGGDAASVREYNGALLVRAPGYIHRQLGGH